MGRLAWGNRVDADFRDRVFDIIADFEWGFDAASWLMTCMAFETGGTFSPSIKNAAGSGATGLIQFMPATARSMNTTTDNLAQLTALHQLHYVQRYFSPYAKRIKNLHDMYMAILLPKYIGKGDSELLFTAGTVVYRQNSGLDKNNDGAITRGEVCAKIDAMLVKGMRPENVFVVN